jgi:hypothetical protein
MDRRGFFAGTLGAIGSMEAAEAAEHAAAVKLDREIGLPWMCDIDGAAARIEANDAADLGGFGRGLTLMGNDPRLPKMPERPTLMDFFKMRFAPANHLLQSANLAMKAGHPEKIVLACLLHDVGLAAALRTDHGYWGAQLVEPYVDEEISWAIRAHQALKFLPDAEAGFEYPKSYVRMFGADYKPEPYIVAAYTAARAHKWYMTARLITLNDLYAFDPKIRVTPDQFTDVIGRHFRQPKEGLGFDGSPVAHMWRSVIWPNNYL